MTQKDIRDAAARAAVQITSEPRQLTARLLELTPELYAHYADVPAQPVDTPDPGQPHTYLRHWDRKPGCQLCGLIKRDPIHMKITDVREVGL